MNLFAIALCSMGKELCKIAQSSYPSIIAPPTPGGDRNVSTGIPATPTTSRNLVGKVVNRTNLQKTNYTMPGTGAVQPNNMPTAEQHGFAPPPVTVA